jgi:hypothetical protein
VRKHSKIARVSAKKFWRLSLASYVVATAILAVGAVTVVSRQNANIEGSSNHERKPPVANKAGKNFVKVEVVGQKVEVDGQTGQIKELTPDEAKKLAAGLKQLINKSGEGRVEEHHSDGSVSINLEDRFQDVTVAKIDEDGNLVQSCVNNAKAAGKFFGIDPEMIENKPSKQGIKVTPGNTQN